MLGGTKLYAEIWEVNPPLWFWSALPSQWLAQHTGIAWQSLLMGQVLLLGAMSAWLVARLIHSPRMVDQAAMMLAQFWLVTIVPLADIGQREHLALIVSLPYAVLIARRHEAVPVSSLMAVGVGLLGAYGFALKHYFVVIPLMLEIWLLLNLRGNWRPWRPELIVLAVSALIYAVSVMLFAPEFLTVMVPMVRMAYDGFKVSPIMVVAQPWVMFWLATGIFLYSQRHNLSRKEMRDRHAFFQVFMIVASGFAFAYFLQQKGWFYQSVPVTGALAMGLALVLMTSFRQMPGAWPWIGAMLLALPASTILTPRPASLPIAHLSEQVLGDIPAGEPVFVAAIGPRLAWPTVEMHRLVWISRTFGLWMLPAVVKVQFSGHATPEFERLADKILQATSQDIRCHPPTKIVIQRAPIASQGSATFGIREFLLRDAPLRRAIEQDYELRPGPSSVYIYQRRHPRAGLVDPRCRAIY